MNLRTVARMVAVVMAVVLLAPMPMRAEPPVRPLPVANTLGRLIAEAEREGAKISLVCVSPDRRAIAAHNATAAMIPASNQKILTTAAAIAAFGPEFHFETQLAAAGKIEMTADGGAKLVGDLIVIGDGDPTISRRFDPADDPRGTFRRWAKKLRHDLGITHVTGALVCDPTIFDREFIHPTWPRDQLLEWYEAPVGGLSFEDNCFRLTVSPGDVGSLARLSSDPPSACIRLGCEVGTVSGTGNPLVSFFANENQRGVARQLVVRGRIPASSRPYSTDVAVADPGTYFATVLAETLAAEGIAIGHGAHVVDFAVPREGLLPLHTERTPLARAITVCNERSQNFYAEQIFKRLGAKIGGGVGSFATGAAAVTTFATTVGVPADEIRVIDGSGMSRENRCSTRALATVLHAMAAVPDDPAIARAAKIFRDSLPIAGESGTLRSRLTGLRGRVFAKTGTLNAVNSLSGYIRADGPGECAGNLYTFSIVVNDLPSHATARALIDGIVAEMAEVAAADAKK